MEWLGVFGRNMGERRDRETEDRYYRVLWRRIRGREGGVLHLHQRCRFMKKWS